MTELKAIMGKPGKTSTAKEIAGGASAASGLVRLRVASACFKLHPVVWRLREGLYEPWPSIILFAIAEVNAEQPDIAMTISWARSSPADLRAHHARDAAALAGPLPRDVTETALPAAGSFRGGLL